MSLSNLVLSALVAWLPILAYAPNGLSAAELVISGTDEGPSKAATPERALDSSVVRDCRRSDQVAVRIGTLQRENASVAAYGILARIADRLRSGLQKIGSVHATAVGRGCTKPGVIVYISSWREVDRAIDAVREALSKEAVNVEVTLQVEAEPVIDWPAR
jgi:hypothetical protein